MGQDQTIGPKLTFFIVQFSSKSDEAKRTFNGRRLSNLRITR